MPDICEICEQRLVRGRNGNVGSCAVCPVLICTRCQKYGFCPTHYRALSPHGQVVVKRVYLTIQILFPIVFFLLIIIGFVQLMSSVKCCPPFFLLWFVGAFALVFVVIARDKVWLRSLWKRYSSTRYPLPPSWHCEACGFENPPIAQAGGQCGRNKSASLRIA